MSICPMGMNLNNNNGKGSKFFDMEPIWLMPSLKHNFIWENDAVDNIKEEEKK